MYESETGPVLELVQKHPGLRLGELKRYSVGNSGLIWKLRYLELTGDVYQAWRPNKTWPSQCQVWMPTQPGVVILSRGATYCVRGLDR